MNEITRNEFTQYSLCCADCHGMVLGTFGSLLMAFFFLLVVFVLFSRIQYHIISCALMVSFEYFPLCVNEYTEEILTHAQYSHYTIYPSVHFAHVTIYMHSIFSLAVVQIFATRHYNDRQMLRIHSQSHTYFTYLTN